MKSGVQKASILACLALLGALIIVLAPAPAHAQNNALRFDGVNDYVTFGANTSYLGLKYFTIECWFYREGTGVSTTTGTLGVDDAIPLLTKGRGQTEGDPYDMNWFLGIRMSDSVLCGDYEEAAGQLQESLNHPIVGVTHLQRNVWYHGALTFDGTTLRLYLNGNLEATVTGLAGRLPCWDSIQHAALGSALWTDGSAGGFFKGIIDEARVWKRPRSQQAIADSMNLQLTAAPGLNARWGLNEGTGTTAGNSISGSPSGTLTNGPTWVAGYPFPSPNMSLDLGSSNAYVTFRDPSQLDLAHFTVETWFRRDGAGTAVSTGSNGVTAVPLVTHGAAEADGDNRDIDYFMGIRSSDNVLCADFEEGLGGASRGLNHPIAGATVIQNGVWHHAAATYDGTTWRLYLDGVLENELYVGQPTNATPSQGAALGTALKSDSTANGFFNGALDEVRIWNYARSLAQVDSTINSEIAGTRSGLVARWGLNEGYGTLIHSTAGAPLPGSIKGSGYSWDATAPFNIVPNPVAPAAPSGLTATAVSASEIDLAWTDNSNNELRFEIQRSTNGVGGPFTPIDTVNSGVTTFANTGLAASTDYCYRARASNMQGASTWTVVACATTPAAAQYALDLGSSNAYVTFRDPSQLDLAQFTIETWFRRDGAGTAVSTGTNGVTAVPLVTHGSAEADGDNRDIDYFFGIRGSDNVLCADLEEGLGGASRGLNHPIAGVTPIQNGVWYHAAATYDGTTWRLYLNGILENELVVGQPTNSTPSQGAALGTSLKSDSTANGYFDGALDEVRIWNYARSAGQIDSTVNDQITGTRSGLVARWGLNEGTGTLIHSTAGVPLPGSIKGSGSSWIGSAPFNLVVGHSPDQPVLVSPADEATGVSLSPTLDVTLSHPDAKPMSATFYGRALGASSGAPFSVIFLPDAQNYTAQLSGGTAAMFTAQTQWVVNHRASLNIAFVDQIGDIVNDGDSQHVEWERAWASMQLLEDPVTTGLPQGIPYDVSVGNHDQAPNGDPAGTTNGFNEYFGVSHFTGRSYYGGHYGSNNDNHYSFFSASGLNFIVISLEYNPAPDAGVLAWADGLLKAYPTRKGIVCCHYMINAGNPGSWSAQGQAVYDALKGNPNLMLMLCGHTTTEGRRVDVYNGHTVNTVLADYQSRTNGGNGWMRIMTFYPAENVIRVKTYSPTLDQYEADADSSSQFTLQCDLSSIADWSTIGTATDVASGAHATTSWPGRSAFSYYEWYVAASDGDHTKSSPVWGFRTQAAAPPEAPTGLTAAAPTYRQVNLAWSDNSSTELQFDIERSTSGDGGPFVPLATVGIDAVSYSDGDVSPSTQYCYRVRATNDAGSSDWTTVACVTTASESPLSLDFGSGSAYATFGRASALDLAQFTLECWFRRGGVGTTTNTGSGGVLAIPLITKGEQQTDGDRRDMNYFLGIRGADSVLCADFEEGTAGATPGLNHPVIGVTPIRTGVWYHAAVTYDGTTWRLYLDGILETELAVGQPPQSQSWQHAGLATAMDTAGTPAGHFYGRLDEVRIWNYARTTQQIQASIDDQIDTPQSGLVARWSMNEGTGSQVLGSAGTSVTGTIKNSGYGWAGPAPFDIVINNPPEQPVCVAPANGATHVSRSPSLDVSVLDSDADSMEVTFYGRAVGTASTQPFSIVVLPDAQYYTAQMNNGTIGIFQAQTRWIANHIDSLNIVYATQIGDITNDGDSQSIEWERAWSAMSTLEDTSLTHLPGGLPYSVCVGNHDQTPEGSATGTTTYFNQYFGVGHFDHQSYYGGHFGFNNDNFFDLFTVSGLGFIVISLEYNTEPSASVMSWADSLLKAYPTRRGIIACHNLISSGNPGAFSSQGQAVYSALKGNPNLFVMVCGHNQTEGRRTDVYQGNTVHTLLADYQGRPHGGDGWLRIMRFYPAENVIRVQTYSPTLDSLEADADSSSQFTLAANLQPLGGWVTIGTKQVASGQHAVLTWPGLNRGAVYEWYATVRDKAHTTIGPTWHFQTMSNVPTAHVIYPNGGEHLTAKLMADIQWNASDDVHVASVDLLFSRNGASGTYIPIATGIPNTGGYMWKVDSVATNDAYVKVVAYDGEGQTGFDVSDAAFAIVVPTDVEGVQITRLAFEMSSAHPFQGAGVFSLAIPRQTPVKLTVYDVSGRRVGVLVNSVYPPGRYRITWDGMTARGRVASGVYFMRLEACGQAINRKVVIVR